MSSRKTFKKGKVFLNYQILRLIGQGGFADIYHVRERKTNNKYALKVEPAENQKNTLKTEENVFKSLGNSPFFPKFINSGETPKYRYYILECLGPSLTVVRKKLPDQKFSISTTIMVGFQMLRCIQQFHKSGYIHRDIKPANFLIRNSRQNPLALIDYGLSRVHINPSTGKPIPARPRTGFAGTCRYASVNAHQYQDLGRRDDLISWFYSMVDMCKGALPWSDLTERDEIYRIKISTTEEQLCDGFPPEFLSIYKCLIQYSYEAEPDYELLMSFLVQAMNNIKSSFDDRYDWEMLTKEEKEHISVVSMDYPANEEQFKPDKKLLSIKPKIPDENGEKEAKKGCCIIC